LEIDPKIIMRIEKCKVLEGRCKRMGIDFGRLIKKELMENILHLNINFWSQ
jgi:hypothetical protein